MTGPSPSSRGKQPTRPSIAGIAGWTVWMLTLTVCLPARAGGKGENSPQASFSGDRAMAELVAQVEGGPRIPGSPTAARTLMRIEQKVRRWVPEVRREPFSHAGNRMMNLVARLSPGKGRPVMVAAHWDTRRWCDRDPDPRWRDRPLPGANDGASGAAILVELARVLSTHRLEREMRLVWLDGEDWGHRAEDMFLGARAYTRRHAQDLPEWGILLDMVGEREVRIPRERLSEEGAPGLLRAIFRRARQLGLTATFPDVPGESVMDDHTVFLDRGVPVVDLIDFDYPEWHTHDDTPARCSPDSLEQVGRLVMSCILDPPLP